MTMVVMLLKTSTENKHLRNCDYFENYPTLFVFYNVGEVCFNCTVGSTFEVTLENPRFTVLYLCCCQNRKGII